MRMSDWSSDVCSSDLRSCRPQCVVPVAARRRKPDLDPATSGGKVRLGLGDAARRRGAVLRIDGDGADMLGDMKAGIKFRAVDGPASRQAEHGNDGFRVLESFRQIEVIAVHAADVNGAPAWYCEGSISIFNQRETGGALGGERGG